MRAWILYLALLCLLLPALGWGQDSVNVSKIGQWMTSWDVSQHLAVRDNYAYVLNATGLAVVNLTNPSSPVQTGFWPLFTPTWRVALYENYACLAAGDSGLYIVDISDPANPFQASRLPLTGEVSWITLQGNHAFLSGNGIYIVDLSDPLHPALIGSLPLLGNSIAVIGNYAGVCDGGNLHVLDISNPANPVEVGSMPIWEGNSSQATAANGFIYLLDISFAQITVADISDPTQPYTATLFGLPMAFPPALAISGNVLYVSSVDDGLCLIDISDPRLPVFISGYQTVGLGFGLALQDSLLIAARCSAGLEVLDLAGPRITSLATYAPSGEINALQVDGDRIYQGERGTGLRVVDVSNPAAPVGMGLFFYPGIRNMTVAGQKAYAVNGNDLRVVDVSDPYAPAQLGVFSLPGSVCDMKAAGNYLYLSELINGLIVLDVSDPANLRQVASYNPGGWTANELELYGDYLYWGCNSAGLRILNIANPVLLEEVGVYPQTIGHLALAPNKLYAVTGHGDSSRVQILSLVQPANPTSLGSFLSEPFALSANEEFFIFSGVSYVQNGLLVINASDPANPFMSGVYPTYSNHVQFQGNYAYVEEHTHLGIYDCSLALSLDPGAGESSPSHTFALRPCYPNPFNASTVASYELRVASQVRLTVWDTAGRLVGTLVEGWQSAGVHQAVFNGSGLASGIYLARLKAGEFTATQKLVLMK